MYRAENLRVDELVSVLGLLCSRKVRPFHLYRNIVVCSAQPTTEKKEREYIGPMIFDQNSCFLPSCEYSIACEYTAGLLIL